MHYNNNGGSICQVGHCPEEGRLLPDMSFTSCCHCSSWDCQAGRSDVSIALRMLPLDAVLHFAAVGEGRPADTIDQVLLCGELKQGWALLWCCLVANRKPYNGCCRQPIMHPAHEHSQSCSWLRYLAAKP